MKWGAKMKTIKYLGIISIVLLMILVGCQSKDEETKTESDTSETEMSEEVENQDDKDISPKEDSTEENEENTTDDFDHQITLEADEDTAKELEKDENVEKVMVQVEATGEYRFVNVDITLKSKADGEKIAQHYADILKEKYPDHIIDMIIIHDGDILFQDTFE